MAIENVVYTVPAVFALGDESANQFRAVKMTSTAFGIQRASVLGEAVLGVLQNKPTAGVAATVAAPGSVTKMKAATGTITPGAKITTDANGRAITAVTGNNVLGYALDTTTAQDQLLSVKLADIGAAP